MHKDEMKEQAKPVVVPGLNKVLNMDETDTTSGDCTNLIRGSDLPTTAENSPTVPQDWSKDKKYLAFRYTTTLKVYPLQELAFNCSDKLQKKRRSGDAKNPSAAAKATARAPTPLLNHDSILWSKEPRLFALEYNNEGKRKYVSSHLGRFVQFYWRECDMKDRNYYELIREKTPCRLYFDIEYNKKANPGISDETNEQLLEEFISELISELETRFRVLVGRKNIVDLDSSTDKKFSRHFIVHLPNKELFADAVTCGVFVKQLIGRLAEEVATEEMGKKGRPLLQKYLFVYTKECTNDIHSDTNRPKTCFVDTGVYTRNRIFRILGSMKKGKSTSAALRIASANEFPFPDDFDNSLLYDKGYGGEHTDDDDDDNNECFVKTRCRWDDYARALVDTLVIPIEVDRIGATILDEVDANAIDFNKTQQQIMLATNPNYQPGSTSTGQKKISYSNNMGTSPFPSLDNFVRTNLAMRKGVNGSVRCWSMDSQHATNSGGDGGYDELYSSVITYQIKDNRWCENIQRCHKSNNVMWHVSIGDQKYWQSCHDPDCRMSSFRGERKDLPLDVKQEIDSVLSAKFEHVSDSFEKALLELSLSRSPGAFQGERKDLPFDVKQDIDSILSANFENVSDSFEKALLELSLSRSPGASEKNLHKTGCENEHSFDRDFGVDESFEKTLLNFDISGKKQQKKVLLNHHSTQKIRTNEHSFESDFDVDESFEKALLNLTLSDKKLRNIRIGGRENNPPIEYDIENEFEEEMGNLKI